MKWQNKDNNVKKRLNNLCIYFIDCIILHYIIYLFCMLYFNSWNGHILSFLYSTLLVLCMINRDKTHRTEILSVTAGVYVWHALWRHKPFFFFYGGLGVPFKWKEMILHLLSFNFFIETNHFDKYISCLSSCLKCGCISYNTWFKWLSNHQLLTVGWL